MMRTGIELMALGRRGAHQLDAHEGEHRDLEAREKAHHPVGEHAAVVPEVGQAGRAACRRYKGRAHHVQPRAHQGHDGHDLDHGEPELDLAEQLHRQQVQAQQQAHAGNGRRPLRQIGEPELRVGRDGDHIGNAGHDPAEPVGPAREEAGPGAQQVGREIDEGAVLQVGQQQLAYGPADGDELDMAVGEIALQVVVTLQALAGWRGLVCHQETPGKTGKAMADEGPSATAVPSGPAWRPCQEMRQRSKNGAKAARIPEPGSAYRLAGCRAPLPWRGLAVD
jgi:hypothetical protein